MGKHFISVLGTGNYEQAIYYCTKENEQVSYETSYIQEALLKLKFDEWKEGDRITVFVTRESKERNWQNREYESWEREKAEKGGRQLPQIHQGLGEILKKEYGAYLEKAENCEIPIGANEEELWTIFQTMYGCIGEGEKLYLDITHSLRNIPIQMLSVIEFARAVKNVSVEGIYYGAYEAGKENDQKVKEAPIFDLITFLDILDWSQAAASFVKYGSSDQISDLYQKSKRRLPAKAEELQGVVRELQNITQGLETSRGYCDINSLKEQKENPKSSNGISILESYFAYKGYLDKLLAKDEGQEETRKQQKNMIKPLGELMGVIDDKVRVFGVESNFELGLASIEWAIRHKRTQQGFTALDETIKTFLCDYYGLDETQQEDRELCKYLSGQLSKQMEEEHAKELTPEIRARAYEKWKEKKEQNKGTEEISQTAYRVIMGIPKELVKMGSDISNCRNSMNHFGYSNKGQFSSKKLENNLKKFYAAFLKCIGSMEEKEQV